MSGLISTSKNIDVVDKYYAQVFLGADQTARIANSNHIEFDQVTGNITITTGSGQVNGQVNLKANNVYKITAGIRVESSQRIKVRLYDVTNATYIGPQIDTQSVRVADSDTSVGTIATIYSNSVDTVLELRIVDYTGVTKIYADSTFINIESLTKYNSIIQHYDLTTPNQILLNNGWFTITPTLPTIAGGDITTITNTNTTYYAKFKLPSEDDTANINISNTVKYVQNSITKYGIIHDKYMDSGDTVIEIFGGTDYQPIATNTYPITSLQFGTKNSHGFPNNPAKWSIFTEDTTVLQVTPVVSAQVENPGSLSITFPKGAWYIKTRARQVAVHTTVAFAGHLNSGLSEANNAYTNQILFIDHIDASFILAGTTQRILSIVNLDHIKPYIVTASKTLYYCFSFGADVGLPTGLQLDGSAGGASTLIQVIDAYL